MKHYFLLVFFLSSCLPSEAQNLNAQEKTDSGKMVLSNIKKDSGTLPLIDSENIILSNAKIDSVKTVADRIYIHLKEEEKNWWSDWLPFFATLIVAYAAYRGVIKQSKASSVSGFRVNWIEDMRVNYSRFLIALRNVDSKIRHGILNPNTYTKDEDREQLNFLKTKIKLMLNHGEKEHMDFWEALTKYMQEHNEYFKGPFSEQKENDLDNMRVKMEELLLVIFKKEWDKAKNFG